MADQTSPAPDPFAMWREWVAQSEKQWNTFLNQAMATDQFSQSSGRFMDLYVNMQKGMNEAMGRYLTTLNLPTRADMLALGDRLRAIEEQLTRIEAGLEPRRPGGEQASESSLLTVSRPPRTKRPAPG